MRKQSIVLLVLMALMLTACGDNDSGAAPSDVTFDIEVIEIKGATDGIDPPSIDPTTLSAGYGFKPPGEYDADNPNKWQVATYLYSPGAMSVVNGDDVTLRFFGINGDSHQMWVEAPDGTKVTDVVELNRGRELILEFTADDLGHYKIVCITHAPTMNADILSVSG